MALAKFQRVIDFMVQEIPYLLLLLFFYFVRQLSCINNFVCFQVFFYLSCDCLGFVNRCFSQLVVPSRFSPTCKCVKGCHSFNCHPCRSKVKVSLLVEVFVISRIPVIKIKVCISWRLRLRLITLTKTEKMKLKF